MIIRSRQWRCSANYLLYNGQEAKTRHDARRLNKFMNNISQEVYLDTTEFFQNLFQNFSCFSPFFQEAEFFCRIHQNFAREPGNQKYWCNFSQIQTSLLDRIWKITWKFLVQKHIKGSQERNTVRTHA